MDKLNIINFSNGIRSEEIQENFNILDNSIKRERLGIGGPGIASGLNITPIVNENQFAINISEASIVDEKGEEYFVPSQTINIERPRLIKAKEYLNADINNQIKVAEIPYAVNRIHPAEYESNLSSAYTGITIKHQGSQSVDDYIRVKNINNKVLTITGLNKRQIEVEYYYTAKRIDTVYIDETYSIRVASSSITSTTPSAVIPKNYKYLIAFIEIDSEYMKSESDIPHADIIIKKDLRSARNIYTDNNGVLYLCGTAFDNLHFIALDKPNNPFPNQLWLDLDSATLYVYKAIDKFVYKRHFQVLQDHNANYFSDFETDVDYVINRKELTVYVNNVQLQNSEYDELFGNIPTSIQTIPENTKSNKYRIYKTLTPGDTVMYTITFSESGYRWVPINKENYVNTTECKVYGVDDNWTNSNYWTSPQAQALGNEEDGYPRKYRYFIFDAKHDRNLFYTANRNEVSVMINQIPLHRDQFTELTLEMIPELPQELQDALSSYWGWDPDTISLANDTYDNTGIGIVLHDSLDSVFQEGVIQSDNTPTIEQELYVEINVNRSVSNLNYRRKLQREATYVDDELYIPEISQSNLSIDLPDRVQYRYGENQLEVYLNGIKLVKDTDYIEGSDLEDLGDEAQPSKHNTRYRAKGAISKQFKILKTVSAGDKINYRITSNFYSYDHINSLIDEIQQNQENNDAKINELYNSTLELYNDINNKIEIFERQINKITGGQLEQQKDYLTINSVISESQLDGETIQRIPQSKDFINYTYIYNKDTYSETGANLTNYIREDDFLILMCSTSYSDTSLYLVPDIDYSISTIHDGMGGVAVYLKLSKNILARLDTGDKIYIRGIKFGREGR